MDRTQLLLKATGIGSGNTVSIDFCSSCSYRGTAVTMKNMLENQFPGINVALANYPPPLPKRMLSKLVPIVQFGVIGIIVGGEQIFPRLGFAAPPNGTIPCGQIDLGVWQALGYSEISFSLSCRVQVFSKLKENRFPGEIELKDLVARRIASSRVVDGLHGGHWS
ncbi:SelT-like protein [Sesamum angolense]|uniref:SelT-like protein n=1 Tax=Sesamum angolense TaxID=2727404 RepID=A0AAE1WME0_9LAMI|nr:SelT-like protein [Sesamum angolense]